MAGSPSAGPLVGRVKCQADVALFRHALAVKSGHLLLHAAVGMRHDKGGVFFRGIISGGRINMGGNLQSVQRIGDWMDVDAASHVFRDGSPVNQPPGIGVVAFNAFCFRKLGLAGWGC